MSQSNLSQPPPVLKRRPTGKYPPRAAPLTSKETTPPRTRDRCASPPVRPQESLSSIETETTDSKKKSTKTKKSILRRRTTKTKVPFNNNISRGQQSSNELKIVRTDSPSPIPIRKKVLLFRVRLQDDNYKTLTIDDTTTAAELCEKLSDRLRRERPEQVWDGCELFEIIDGEEIAVDGSRVLSVHLDIQYLFKRQGEKVANAEEELQQIIKQRKQLRKKRNNAICVSWFGCSMNTFPSEDQEYLNCILDILAYLSNDKSTVLPAHIPQRLAAIEESVNQAKKKYVAVKKVKKRPARLFVDTTHVHVLRKIADAGGSYASIYSVLVDGLECAMKELILDGAVDTSAFLTEIAVLDALPPHPNLVHYLFQEQTSCHIRLFMSLYDESLSDYIERKRALSNGPFPLNVIKRCLTQIISGIDYLHSFFIMHRDLKSGNIFVRLNGNGELLELVVADFDTAIQVENETFVLRQTMGTPGFMAPEVLKAKEIGYTISSDIFSFGMLIWELLFLCCPYRECENSYDISENIIKGEPPKQPFTLGEEYSPYLELHRACTTIAQDRPSSSDLITRVKKLPETKEQAIQQITASTRLDTIARDFLDAISDQSFINPLYNTDPSALL